MRRTLTVLVASAALLVPASAASAAPPGGFTNASCSSGEQRGPDGMFTYNEEGSVPDDADPECGGEEKASGPSFDGGSTT